MLNNIPSGSDMTKLIGEPLFNIWQKLCADIEEKYDMEQMWNSGGKKWIYEYKYRRGGKTLCALYAKENCIGFMVIFGKEERAKFEKIRNELSDDVCKEYDEAETYHDGKWVMFKPENETVFRDYLKILDVKRKPNKK